MRVWVSALEWGSIAGAWLMGGRELAHAGCEIDSSRACERLARSPRGFFTGGGRMNLTTGAFDVAKDNALNVSHLSAAFGLPEELC